MVLLILCFIIVPASADVREYVLDNGLKLLVKEDHRAPVVVSQVWYKVGSSYEYDGITGISHALEHMMFKGTKKRGEGEFSRIIAENGGNENAFTGADYTAYFQTLEKSRLPTSLELEADRMRNLVLRKEAFSNEIQVVMEERRLSTEDNPNSYLYEIAKATAYLTSPYRQPNVGWMADLQNMKVEQLRDWYELWYAPNNATVIVVGDVVPDEVFKLTKKFYGHLKPERIIPPADRPEVTQTGMKRINVKRPAEVPQLLLAYKVPGLQSSLSGVSDIELWEPYALEVLSGILSGGSSARFESRLVRGSEVAASVYGSYSMSDRLDSLFTITAIPAQGKSVAELESAIKAELVELQQTDISDDELLRVKAQVVSSDIFQKDSAFFQAMILGMYETVGLGWRAAEDYVESIQEVSAEQVKRVARKYFNDDLLTVAALEPVSTSDKMD